MSFEAQALPKHRYVTIVGDGTELSRGILADHQRTGVKHHAHRHGHHGHRNHHRGHHHGHHQSRRHHNPLQPDRMRTLVVRLVQVRGLYILAEPLGLASLNPFVKLEAGGRSQTTMTYNHRKAATWSVDFEFPLDRDEDDAAANDYLAVGVYHSNSDADVLVGSMAIRLDDLQANVKHDLWWFPLNTSAHGLVRVVCAVLTGDHLVLGGSRLDLAAEAAASSAEASVWGPSGVDDAFPPPAADGSDTLPKQVADIVVSIGTGTNLPMVMRPDMDAPLPLQTAVIEVTAVEADDLAAVGVAAGNGVDDGNHDGGDIVVTDPAEDDDRFFAVGADAHADKYSDKYSTNHPGVVPVVRQTEPGRPARMGGDVRWHQSFTVRAHPDSGVILVRLRRSSNGRVLARGRIPLRLAALTAAASAFTVVTSDPGEVRPRYWPLAVSSTVNGGGFAIPPGGDGPALQLGFRFPVDNYE